MDNKHYQEQELKLFFEPGLDKKDPDMEREILEHLRTCEACAGLAKQVQEGMWGEIRDELGGFR